MADDTLNYEEPEEEFGAVEEGDTLDQTDAELDDELPEEIENIGEAGEHMRLNEAALQALEVFSLCHDLDTELLGATDTLYEHLNRCRTKDGRSLLRDWLKHPLTSIQEINRRLNVVEAMASADKTVELLHDNLLQRLPDTYMIALRMEKGQGTLARIYRAYQMASMLPAFDDALEKISKSCPTIRDMFLKSIRRDGGKLEDFRTLVEEKIDLEWAQSTGQCRIRPMSDEMKEIAERLTELSEKAKDELQKVIELTSCERISLVLTDDEGYYFKTRNESTIRDQPTLEQLKMGKLQGVCFRTSKLRNINEEHVHLAETYADGQVGVASEVVQSCAVYAPIIKKLARCLAALDVLVAFSLVCNTASSSYVRPELLEKGSGELELLQCRHPVIERTPDAEYMPNDISFGLGEEQRRFIILMGANMGGKSTYLRSAALNVLLAQVGCLVPCSSARISIVDGIYTRVGAGDAQHRGISTFMAEMLDCATMLKEATADSLVIIDELGRGTSTEDGLGLAWAIAEDVITRVECFCLFATHFHEFGQMGEVYPDSVRNLLMSTEIGEGGHLTFLYQVVPGVADRSFGLNIAKMVGFPKHVTKAAKKLLIKFEEGYANFADEVQKNDDTIDADYADVF